MTSPMTPTTPPAIPSDILEAAREVMIGLYLNPERDAALVAAIARALLAAQERGKLMERERAIAACERQKADFLSTEYAFNQPLGSLLERFACDECIEAIREGAE